MPDEPKPQDGPKDEDLDAELAEFEAELFRAAEGLPRSIVDPQDPGEPSSEAPELPSREDIEARLSRAIRDAEGYLGPVRSGVEEWEEDALSDETERKPAAGKLDEAHAEFEGEIARLSQRAREARQTHQKQVKREGPKAREQQDQTRGMAFGFALAYGFVGPLLAGYLVGWLIDQQTGRQNVWQTWLTVVGLFLGFLFVIVMLNRTTGERRG
jgi:F0F1-type ATP synthase assembly protein I